MKINPHQRSRASGVQATADFIAQMEWGALRHMPPATNGNQAAYIVERNDPQKQGCLYIIARLKKGEAHARVGVDIFSDKDKRPNVQLTLARNGVITLTYAGTWPGNTHVPAVSIFKIEDGDRKAFMRLRQELQRAALHLLTLDHGPAASTLYQLCLKNQHTQRALMQAQEKITYMEKTGIIGTRVANTDGRMLMEKGVSGAATAHFGGSWRVTAMPAANAAGKPKVEPS